MLVVMNPDTQKHIQGVEIGLAPKIALENGKCLGPNPKITKICIANKMFQVFGNGIFEWPPTLKP